MVDLHGPRYNDLDIERMVDDFEMRMQEQSNKPREEEEEEENNHDSDEVEVPDMENLMTVDEVGGDEFGDAVIDEEEQKEDAVKTSDAQVKKGKRKYAGFVS